MTVPTSRARTKLLVCAGFAVFGGLIGWLNAPRRGEAHDSTQLVDNSGPVRELLEHRANLGAAALEVPVGTARSPSFAHLSIPSEHARTIFPIDNRHLVYDAFTYFRYAGGLREDAAWPEYPGGHYERRTSRDGYRESFESLPEERDFLVVVAGDSQTDGMCDSSETYPNLAEAELASRHPGSAIEVLNAGVAAYSFHNYLGTLEKLLAANPDVFVMAFYAGNDFKDLVVPAHYFRRTPVPPAAPEYVARLKQAIAAHGSDPVIALNPIAYFKHAPEDVEIARVAAQDVCGRVRRLCREFGIELIVIHIPPAFRPGGALPPALAAVQRALGLSDEDMRTDERMADELITTLRQWNVDVLDMREHFPEDVASCFWSDFMHLNLRGQRAVAAALVPKLEAAYARCVR